MKCDNVRQVLTAVNLSKKIEHCACSLCATNALRLCGAQNVTALHYVGAYFGEKPQAEIVLRYQSVRD